MRAFFWLGERRATSVSPQASTTSGVQITAQQLASPRSSALETNDVEWQSSLQGTPTQSGIIASGPTRPISNRPLPPIPSSETSQSDHVHPPLTSPLAPGAIGIAEVSLHDDYIQPIVPLVKGAPTFDAVRSTNNYGSQAQTTTSEPARELSRNAVRETSGSVGTTSIIVPDPSLREALDSVVPESQAGELYLDRHKLDLALEPLKPFFIPLADLRMEDLPGEGLGRYGVVRVALFSPSDGSPPVKVAVKELTDPARALPLRIAFRIAREMTVWSKLDHPNVLPFTGYHLSDDMDIAYLVCPYLEEGNIRDYLRQHNPDYSVRASLVQDTIEGLKYLHSINVCHGDLKSFNVLVTSKEHAMLCDFGQAGVMQDQPTGLTTSTEFKGSFRWCSPELIDNYPRDFLSDIWAWACLALEIVTGDFPYNDVPLDVAVINWIIKGSTPANATRSCKILPKGMLGLWDLCWSIDPSARPDAATCANAWFVCWDKVEWHSSFLEGASVRPASVDIVPSTRATQPTATPRQKPVDPHTHTWQAGSGSNPGLPSIGATLKQGHLLNRPVEPPAQVVANRTSPRIGRNSPLLRPTLTGTEGQGSPHYDESLLQPVMSSNSGSPIANVATLPSSPRSRARGTTSEGGRRTCHDTVKEMTRLIMRAAELEDRVLWIEICEKGSTPQGARDIGGNIKSWLKHGAEPIRLTAVRTWVLALKGNYQPFLSLTSGKGFLKMIKNHYSSSHTPETVKKRLFDAIAGAAWEYGASYPEFRSCWTTIKGYGTPCDGIPYDLHDPFFSLPPAPSPRGSMAPLRRSHESTIPVEPQRPNAVTVNQTSIESPPLSPRTRERWGHSPASSLGSPATTVKVIPQVVRSDQGHPQVHTTPAQRVEDRLAISVDFGTTMSGVAYASLRINSGRVQSIVHWPGSQATFRKIPTCLQYDIDGHVIAWGLEAKTNGEIPHITTCEWFKLFLEPRNLRDPTIIDRRLPRLPPDKKPKDLIVDYLFHLFDYAKQQITMETGLVRDLDLAEVWLTVPASWDQIGCSIMREAAIAAGMVKKVHVHDHDWQERLHIIPEPEAAAVHCVALTSLHRLQPSETFMICDAGGGTVDIATYKIIGDLSSLEIAEVCANSGVNSGSIFLDLRFQGLVRTLLADHPVHLDPPSFANFTRAFAECEKLDFKGGDDDCNFFHFSCFNVEDQNDPSVGLVNGELSIPGVLLRREVFDPIIDEVIAQLEDQMRRSGRAIDALLLVGGFSENPYLFKRVFERFRDQIPVIARPDDADTATNRGAAQYGLTAKSPVSSVIAPRSYLMIAKLPAEKLDEKMRPAYIQTNAAGARVCERRIEYLVRKGAVLRKGQRLISKFCKYSASAMDHTFEAVLYTSESDTEMRYTDEGPVSALCRWSVDLATLPLFQRRSREHPDGFFITFELGLELDSAEVRGVLLQDGKEVSRVVFDFFQ